MHDGLNVQALPLAKQNNQIDALPSGFDVVVDNAYMISEHLLIPLSGSHQQHVHITVPTTTWGVVWNKTLVFFLSQGGLSATSSILLGTCARLHNLIIINDWQLARQWRSNICRRCGKSRWNSPATSDSLLLSTWIHLSPRGDTDAYWREWMPTSGL